MEVIIGVDEAGTGAWFAGYTVTALASYSRDADRLRKAGGRDSKKMTDIARRAAIDEISTFTLFVCTEFVSVAAINARKKDAWRDAVVAAVTDVVGGLLGCGIERTSIVIVVDGLRDWRTERRINDELKITKVRFLTGAEDQVPAVGAASVFAKVTRDDAMRELHKIYPEYGIDRNKGYGTKQHSDAILKHGRSPEHRDIKVGVLGWKKETK